MNVEFDPTKSRTNQEKHGIGFEEATETLLDPMALAMEDPFSRDEQRWVLIGMSDRLRLLTVVYSLRGEAIRIISVRKSTNKEAQQYAQGI